MNKITLFREPTESALLYSFLGRLQRLDPDVIVGHNFVGFDLDVLLHRLKGNIISVFFMKIFSFSALF